MLASAPILLLISSAGGYWLSRTALKPVDKITAAVRSISIRNLSERLPVAETGDELQRLAETCNAMMGRLESSVKRIEQFTEDASHELRGPLSFTRTVAEVALRNPHADAESRQAFADIVEETGKASVLLEDMLTLARADAGSCHTALEPVNLASVVEEACEMARPLADKRRLVLSVSLGAARWIKVLGDFQSLRRLLWILLDNALKYTDPPGRIDVTLNAASGKPRYWSATAAWGLPQPIFPTFSSASTEPIHHVAKLRAADWAWQSQSGSPRFTMPIFLLTVRSATERSFEWFFSSFPVSKELPPQHD